MLVLKKIKGSLLLAVSCNSGVEIDVEKKFLVGLNGLSQWLSVFDCYSCVAMTR